MPEDVFTKRKRLTDEAAAMADDPEGTGLVQKLNPMRPVMQAMKPIKAAPDPTFDKTKGR